MDEFIGLIAVIMVFSIPLVAILSGPIRQALAQRERREARKLYERLSLEKLDVIKTAVAMGMDKSGLADLDDRLERLIGADQMQTLLLDKDPHAPRTLVSDTSLAGLELEEAVSAGRRSSERQ